ncbi:TIGR02757 family protein [Campylobacter sp. VicNov18]|uniref:TIGR02757 family protein n=1 Tax=Campylobacter bilis TaxID=2691918 RepID=UPI00130D6972|nr:TIGR02757 family protein [Campylobacter bilis]MPV63968.1 TIGR02757 family protein [Campylobacter hepaticus]MBM0637469.1 TIGR02757 family protein [Campylobacter bilis]MCC8278188.1 TIGR02757 family protein [Campylobacter bilis]MCC8299692.1 TIGR02757 family protein [Campylobacter bilis]MCC8301097.1 TIGR02757 family protein [Campylobacter bilis]
MQKFNQLKAKLDLLANKKNTMHALFQAPDPLQIAKIYNDEFIALLCALFAYGNAKNILNFLNKLDFSLLDCNQKQIQKELKGLKYRFQNEQDIQEIFITLSRLKNEISLNELFTKAYEKRQSTTDAILAFMQKIQKLNPYSSYGYDFFFGKIWKNTPSSTLKRYNMYLRWMVRKDELDLGLFTKIHIKDLLIPLDTHTHKISLTLGLLKRTIYDYKSVVELTQNLKKLDPNDPVKYDFALYRLGQSKEIDKF